MIEINLIPDIKQELIRARRIQSLVVSGAIFVGIASVAVVVLLAIYLFGVQTLRSNIDQGAINDNESKLAAVPDLANMLTIQSQLSNITKLHDQKNVDSRLFPVLTAINPAAPNQISFSTVSVDSQSNMIHIDGQATGGFAAVDTFKKTIQATTVTYQDSGQSKKEPLTEDVAVSNLSYGEDASGAKVLRFSVDFKYTTQLFARASKGLIIAGPNRQDATDSYKYLPESLFSTRATDLGGPQ